MQHRVHGRLGLDAGGRRLQRLRAADLGPRGRHGGVVGHVLGLERRDAHAGAGQPSADAGRHDALAGVGRRPAHEQRAPHRADTLPVAIGLPPARVEPAHLDPAAARRHRAPAPPAARVEEQPAARGPRAAVHARQARRVGEQRHGVDRDREADGARVGRRPASGARRRRRRRRAARRPPPRRGRAPARRGRPGAAGDLRASAEKTRCSTSRSARRGLELGVVDDRQTARAPRPAGGPSGPGRGGCSSASVLGVSGLAGGRPVDAVGEVQAQRAAPELDRLRGDACQRSSYHLQP